MKQKIVFVDINKLIQHERVCRARLRAVYKQINGDGVIRRPVIVDKTTNVVLDGHHRVQALRDLGAKRVPVVYVNYSDDGVRVYLRRKELLMNMIKRSVLETALSQKLFPYKTTRHCIHNRPTMKAVCVSELKNYL